MLGTGHGSIKSCCYSNCFHPKFLGSITYTWKQNFFFSHSFHKLEWARGCCFYGFVSVLCFHINTYLLGTHLCNQHLFGKQLRTRKKTGSLRSKSRCYRTSSQQILGALHGRRGRGTSAGGASRGHSGPILFRTVLMNKHPACFIQKQMREYKWMCFSHTILTLGYA